MMLENKHSTMYHEHCMKLIDLLVLKVNDNNFPFVEMLGCYLII